MLRRDRAFKVCRALTKKGKMYKCSNCGFRTVHKHVLKAHVEHEKRKKKAGKELSEEFLKYCRENRLDKVADCLTRGVDVNTVSEDGCWTALHIACYKGYPELLNILLDQPNLDHNTFQNIFLDVNVNKTVRVSPQVLTHRAVRRAGGTEQADGSAD